MDLEGVTAGQGSDTGQIRKPGSDAGEKDKHSPPPICAVSCCDSAADPETVGLARGRAQGQPVTSGLAASGPMGGSRLLGWKPDVEAAPAPRSQEGDGGRHHSPQGPLETLPQ